MARHLKRHEGIDVSHNFVCVLWRENGLQSHRQGTFKLSRDPQFAVKVADIVALYLDPPQGAVALSVDEKTQIQALDRTARRTTTRPVRSIKAQHHPRPPMFPRPSAKHASGLIRQESGGTRDAPAALRAVFGTAVARLKAYGTKVRNFAPTIVDHPLKFTGTHQFP